MRDLFLYLLVALVIFLFIELNGKYSQIDSLESTLKLTLKFAVEKPIYIQTYQHIGDINIMSEDNGITITPQGDAVGISIGDDNYQEGVFAKTSGDVANFVSESAGSREEEVSPKIKAVFAQIQKTIENNDDLSPDEKNYALQQLKSLESTSSANKRKIMEAESDEIISDTSIV